MDAAINRINWFEIPVREMSRAKTFYQNVFNLKMNERQINGRLMAYFPLGPGKEKASGALVQSDWHKPSTEGVVIYLNANPNLDPVLEKVKQEGGRILMKKTRISPENGYMAFFIDTEGNRVALHSQH